MKPFSKCSFINSRNPKLKEKRNPNNSDNNNNNNSKEKEEDEYPTIGTESNGPIQEAYIRSISWRHGSILFHCVHSSSLPDPSLFISLSHFLFSILLRWSFSVCWCLFPLPWEIDDFRLALGANQSVLDKDATHLSNQTAHVVYHISTAR